jgi:hypothetical protein
MDMGVRFMMNNRYRVKELFRMIFLSLEYQQIRANKESSFAPLEDVVTDFS